MNKLSVGQRLTILVALPLAVILVLVVSSLSSFSSINAGVGRIYDARVVPLAQLKIVNDGYAATVVDAINKTDRGMMTPAEAVADINQALELAHANWQRSEERRVGKECRARWGGWHGRREALRTRADGQGEDECG